MAKAAAERRLDHSRRPRQRSLGPARKRWGLSLTSPKTSFLSRADRWLGRFIRAAPSRCTRMTWLCRARAVRLKCQEPVEGRQQWACLIRLQTGKGNAEFQQARHLLLARQASPVPAYLSGIR